jgi:hypothetical protein
MSELKPCPFCGAIAKEWVSDTPVPFSLYDIHHTKRCFLYRPGSRFEGADRISTLHQSEIAAWNRRAIGVEKRTKAKRAGR